MLLVTLCVRLLYFGATSIARIKSTIGRKITFGVILLFDLITFYDRAFGGTRSSTEI